MGDSRIADLPPPEPSGLVRRSFITGTATCLMAGALGGQNATASPAAASVPASPADNSAELLLVGPGKRYPSITAAGERLATKWDPFAKTVSHDPIHMIISPAEPGYYDEDWDTYSRRWPNHNHGGWPPYHGFLAGPAIIEGEPGKPAPDLTCNSGGDGVLYYQKGAWITTDYDATFRRLNFAGFRRVDGYGNYAAIRLDDADAGKSRRGNFLFEDVRISGCDDGILGGSPGQTVTLRRCEFTQNGGNVGRTHNIYIGPVDLLTVEDVLSTRSIVGHLLKTRAAKTVIRRTRLLTGDGTTSACLDVPDGGILDIDGLMCEKGPNSDASWVIHYGGENQDSGGLPFHAESSITIRNLTMVAPPSLVRHPTWGVDGFTNQSGAGEDVSGKGSRLINPDATGVRVFGLTAKRAGFADVTVLDVAPVLDWTSPVRRG